MDQSSPEPNTINWEDRKLFRSAMLDYIHGRIDEYDFQCAIASIDEKREQDVLYDVMIEEVQYYLVVLEYCYENLAEPKFDHNNRIEPEDLALFERLADCLDSDMTCLPEDLHAALHKQLRLDEILANIKLTKKKRMDRIIFWLCVAWIVAVLFVWGFGAFWVRNKTMVKYPQITQIDAKNINDDDFAGYFSFIGVHSWINLATIQSTNAHAGGHGALSLCGVAHFSARPSCGARRKRGMPPPPIPLRYVE